MVARFETAATVDFRLDTQLLGLGRPKELMLEEGWIFPLDS